MGYSSSRETVQEQYRTSLHQNVTTQNQNVINQNQNVVIQLPDPKLFEFKRDFLKDCDNIEKITYSDFEYEGQVKDRKRNGKRKMIWSHGKWKGDIYESEFKDGYRHGKGIYKYNNVQIYNGEWNMGDQEGWGIMKYNDSFYEGEWKKNKINGKGKKVWTDGKWKDDRYKGEFKDGYRHGRGVYKYYNGPIYNGEMEYGSSRRLGNYKI